MPRKKKTDAEKKLSGTDQPVRLRGKVTGGANIPAPTRSMTEAESAIYYRVAQHLADRDAIMDVDADLIYQYAASAARMNRFLDQLKDTEGEGGVIGIQTYASGARNIAPEYTLIEKELKILTTLGSELGIGVKSREKIEAFREQPDDEVDPFLVVGRNSDLA